MRLTRVDFQNPVHIAGNMMTSASAPSCTVDFDEKTEIVTVATRDKRILIPLGNVKAMHPAESLRAAAEK